MHSVFLKIVSSTENPLLRKENGFLFLLNKPSPKIKEGSALDKQIAMSSGAVKTLYSSIDQNNINNIDILIEKKISHLKKNNHFREENAILKEHYPKFIKDLVPSLYDIELINKNAANKKINPSSLYDAVKTLINNKVVFPYAYFKENMNPTIVLLSPSSKYDVSVDMLREACLNYSAEAYRSFAAKKQDNQINLDLLPDPGNILFFEGEYLPDHLKLENSSLIHKFEEILEKKLNSLFNFKDYGDLYHPKIELSLLKEDFIGFLTEEHPELAIKLSNSYTVAADSLTSDTIPPIIEQYRELILHYRTQSSGLEKYGLIALDITLNKNQQFDEEISKLEEKIKIFKTSSADDERADKILGNQTILRIDELIQIIEQALAIKTLKLDQDNKLLAGLKNVLELKEKLTEIWAVIKNELDEQEKRETTRQLKNTPEVLPENQSEKTLKKESFFKKYYDLPVGIATFTVGITASGLLNFIAEAPLGTLLTITVAGTVVLPVFFKLLKKTNNNNIKQEKITGKQNNRTTTAHTGKATPLTKRTIIQKNMPETLAIKEILYGTAFDAEPSIIVPDDMIAGLKNKMIRQLQSFSQFKDKPISAVLNFINNNTSVIDLPYYTNDNIPLPAKFKNKGPLKLFYVGSKLDRKTKQEIIETYQKYFNKRITGDMKVFLEAHLKKLREDNKENE